MGFNFSSFLNKVKETATSVASSVVDAAKTYTPEKWSPEKQYINGMVASMALMVYADGVVENEEVELVLDEINNNPLFKEYDMVIEGLELYTRHIEALTTAKEKGKADYALEVAKISTDIGKVKKDEWKNNIIELSQKISASDGDIAEDELKMLNKIKISLGM